VSDFSCPWTRFYCFFGSVRCDLWLVLLERVTANGLSLPVTRVAGNTSPILCVDHAPLLISDVSYLSASLILH
jgi:hypothetical protein